MEQRLLEFRDPRSWKFRPYVTRLLKEIASTFHEWFRRIVIRQHGLKLSFSHSPAIVQLNLSTVNFCLLLNEINWNCSFWHEIFLK